MKYPVEIDPNFVWQPFYFLPNFVGVKFAWLHATAVLESKKNREQRRPLLSRPLREQSFEILLSVNDAQEFLIFSRAAQGQFVGVPVVNEPLVTADVIQGATTITTKQNLSCLSSIKNYTRFVILYELEQKITAIKEITNIQNDVDQFDFLVPVVNNFLSSNTILYPLFIGALQEPEIKMITDGVLRATITVSEVFLE